MNANNLNSKQAGRASRLNLRWIMLLSMLFVFTVSTTWQANQSPAMAAEPNLSLLNSAFATSMLQSQMSADLSSPLVIPPAAFNPDSNTRTWYFGWNSGYIYLNGAGNYCGHTAVYLPDRALITSFEGYVYDNKTPGNVELFLYAKPIASMDNANTIAEASTIGASTTMQLISDASVSPTRVNNFVNSYYVVACIWGVDEQTRFYSVQVGYEMETFLPMISR